MCRYELQKAVAALCCFATVTSFVTAVQKRLRLSIDSESAKAMSSEMMSECMVTELHLVFMARKTAGGKRIEGRGLTWPYTLLIKNPTERRCRHGAGTGFVCCVMKRQRVACADLPRTCSLRNSAEAILVCTWGPGQSRFSDHVQAYVCTEVDTQLMESFNCISFARSLNAVMRSPWYHSWVPEYRLPYVMTSPAAVPEVLDRCAKLVRSLK